MSIDFARERPRNFPLKSNVFESALAEFEALKNYSSSEISMDTSKPVAGCSSMGLFVGGGALMVVGVVSKSTDFTGQPLKSTRDLASNAGVVTSNTWFDVNLVNAFDAAWRSLKANGTRPSMYCVGSFDTSTH